MQNIIVGFFVSFVGSIPLGYLNVVGFQIYHNSDLSNLVQYLFGVVLIEGFVIYGTLVLARKISGNTKFLKAIAAFSVVFMLVLSVIFYIQLNSNSAENQLYAPLKYSSFLTGIILSSLNFVQIPFWVGWNLYLLNNSYIFAVGYLKILYAIGTIIGTFIGMLGFVLILQHFTDGNILSSNKIISIGIPAFFLIMAIFQGFKFFKKY